MFYLANLVTPNLASKDKVISTFSDERSNANQLIMNTGF